MLAGWTPTPTLLHRSKPITGNFGTHRYAKPYTAEERQFKSNDDHIEDDVDVDVGKKRGSIRSSSYWLKAHVAAVIAVLVAAVMKVASSCTSNHPYQCCVIAVTIVTIKMRKDESCCSDLDIGHVASITTAGTAL